MPAKLLLLILVAACGDIGGTASPDAEPTPSSPGPFDRAPLGRATPPRITDVAWHWISCGPSGGTPLPFSLVVTVTTDSAEPLAIKGQATDCKGFDANAQPQPCIVGPHATLRSLDVAVSDANGVVDRVTTPVADCVDGELVP